jgi:hypothetical protein
MHLGRITVLMRANGRYDISVQGYWNLLFSFLPDLLPEKEEYLGLYIDRCTQPYIFL